MTQMLDDPQIIAALISAVGGLFTALITSIVALFIGKKFAKVELLKKQLATAAGDITFLLEVERQHSELHKQHVGQSMLLTVRREAKAKGLMWSGEFIPSRSRRFTDKK